MPQGLIAEPDFRAIVIEDSVSPYGIRLTTFQLRYPRFIHAEFMTHRVFSRNARSSRAVPVERLLKEEPFVPHFMANQKGMQAFSELSPEKRDEALIIWAHTSKVCKKAAQELGDLEVHKQWANRMLEWFGFIDVVVTATDWDNFFHLRDHEMAMPEIQELARHMKRAMEDSIPKQRMHEEWHLPYVSEAERQDLTHATQLLVSVARCGRVSYKPFDSETVDVVADRKLAERLIVQDPLHASPAEHQAVSDHIMPLSSGYTWQNQKFWGNLYTWKQYRKMLPKENMGSRRPDWREMLDYQRRLTDAQR